MARVNVTQLSTVLEKGNGSVFHVGIDVHKHSYHVAFLGEKGQEHTFVCSARPEEFVHHLKRCNRKIAQVVYESGPTGFELARVLEEAGFTVSVVAPSRVPQPVTLGAKTDRLDFVRLAHYSASGMLTGIAVQSRSQEAQRSLIRRRNDLIDSIRRAKQRIRSLLLYHSVKEPAGLDHWSDKSVKDLLMLPLQPWVLDTLKSLVRELAFLKKETQGIERRMRCVCNQVEQGKVFEYLQTVPGVGPITAATFQLEMFDPGRFKTGGQVASYLGLAPMVRQSGENKGRVTLRPVGQKRLCSLLIEASWCWCRKDDQAGAKYRRIVSKANVPQKAIAAVARKLAIILWRLSLEQHVYEVRTLVA